MVRTDTLEQIVWADIERFLHDPGDVLAELAHDRDGSAAVAEAEAITLRRALDTLEEQQRTAVSLVVRGILPEAILRPELDRIEHERAKLEPRLAAAEASGAPELPHSAPELLAEVRARLDAGLRRARRSSASSSPRS